MKYILSIYAAEVALFLIILAIASPSRPLKFVFGLFALLFILGIYKGLKGEL